MSRPRASQAEPVQVTTDKPGTGEDAVEHMKQAERGIPLNPADPHSECVPRAEYDAFVKDIRNQMSRMKEEVDDLHRIVTQPEGAITFLEAAPRPMGEVPWYGARPIDG